MNIYTKLSKHTFMLVVFDLLAVFVYTEVNYVFLCFICSITKYILGISVITFIYILQIFSSARLS